MQDNLKQEKKLQDKRYLTGCRIFRSKINKVQDTLASATGDLLVAAEKLEALHSVQPILGGFFVSIQTPPH